MINGVYIPILDTAVLSYAKCLTFRWIFHFAKLDAMRRIQKGWCNTKIAVPATKPETPQTQGLPLLNMSKGLWMAGIVAWVVRELSVCTLETWCVSSQPSSTASRVTKWPQESSAKCVHMWACLRNIQYLEALSKLQIKWLTGKCKSIYRILRNRSSAPKTPPEFPFYFTHSIPPNHSPPPTLPSTNLTNIRNRRTFISMSILSIFWY